MIKSSRVSHTPPPPDIIKIEMSVREAAKLMYVLRAARMHEKFCDELFVAIEDLGVEPDEGI